MRVGDLVLVVGDRRRGAKTLARARTRPDDELDSVAAAATAAAPSVTGTGTWVGAAAAEGEVLRRLVATVLELVVGEDASESHPPVKVEVVEAAVRGGDAREVRGLARERLLSLGDRW